METIFLIPQDEFLRVQKADLDPYVKCLIISNMCRVNALAAVKKAGSGHLGSSFSAMDIVVWLYYQEMNTIALGKNHPDRDIYFSSKGHDVPGLYAVLFALGLIPKAKLLKLRRLGGLDGHPHVSIDGIEVNSGSLGMGISKAKGMALAKTILGRQGQVFVLTGDGELQEGQIFEGLQTTIHQKIFNLTVIVDHNKVQSDKPVSEIINLGNLEEKFKSFGWYVDRCDGHDFKELEQKFSTLKGIKDKPKLLIADTIKGRGVSFMEHPQALMDAGGIYRWHSGAPDDLDFQKAYDEIINKVQQNLNAAGISKLSFEQVLLEKKPSGVTPEYIADAFGRTLVEVAKERKEIVVIDADLAADCRLREFEKRYPQRFIENGIAEQDMVSMAGGLALHGLLPVVNSFSAFLAARSNEQIYNNAGENTKIIYACHYAGLIPAGPGLSHQSIRDISLLGSLPNMIIIQPCNGRETEQALKFCVYEAKENCALRLVIGPSPRKIDLPDDYYLTIGCGIQLFPGNDGVIFAYGPVMLHEALTAAELLNKMGFTLKVVNLPWLNRLDMDWFEKTIASIPGVYVLEDHSPIGGLGDYLINKLVENDLLKEKRFKKFSVEGYPAWGTPGEVLKYHGLDGESLAKRIFYKPKVRKNL